MQLKNTLQMLKKSSLSIHGYMRRRQDIVDVLTTGGNKISYEELINFILDGIGSEFDLAAMHTTSTLDSTIKMIKSF